MIFAQIAVTEQQARDLDLPQEAEVPAQRTRISIFADGTPRHLRPWYRRGIERASPLRDQSVILKIAKERTLAGFVAWSSARRQMAEYLLADYLYRLQPGAAERWAY